MIKNIYRNKHYLKKIENHYKKIKISNANKTIK
jgi:hypothetical protein